jgi:hypothetical protein
MFKNPARTSKKIQQSFITKASGLMLFKGIIAVYSENYTNSVNKLSVKKQSY